ncbi:MAG: PAS domain-containing protein [Deltaproteobacteria bacterium]|nr:PAS domain-containing protein [Deltaproteobacteria bacterium]
MRARFIAGVVAIAFAAWLAGEAAHGLAAPLRALVVLGAALGLGALLVHAHVRRLEEVRGALDAVLAGAPRARIERSSSGAIGALSRAVDAVGAALRVRDASAAAARERLEAVLDAMVEGVLVLGPDGRVQLANARLRELFSVWGEVAGRTPLEVIRRADVDELLGLAGRTSEPVALDLALGDDGSLEVHARRFPAQGERQGVVAVFHDVSEIRRLESHRREFVANVSHELRTPLTAIQGYAETLAANDLEPERRKQYVETITRNAERLRALIEDLLELARVEGGKRTLAPEAIDASAFIAALLRELRPRLEARRLAASCVGAAQVLADRRALEQIVQNLLDNAVKYTEPGGRIEVRLSRDGARARIEVADTGIGIPERDRARVFERFYRVDKARSRDLGGTGLGLSIVKHLAQAMDGDIFVTSAEGQGSTFTVTLPAA